MPRYPARRIPSHFFRQSHLSMVHPTVSVGFPTSHSRGVLDHHNDTHWDISKIGGASLTVIFDFPAGLSAFEMHDRVIKGFEEEVLPEGATPVALQLKVRLIAICDDGGQWPSLCKHSELLFEFIAETDLPVLGQIVNSNFLGLTTPEASSETHHLSFLCDVP